MIKKLILILLIVSLFLLIGCDKEDSDYLECNELNYPALREVSTLPRDIAFFREENGWCCIREPSEVYGSCMELKEK